MLRPVRALVLLGFGLFLLAPLTATVAGVRPVELENRPIEPWPDPELTDLASDETYDHVTSYLVDRFPLRSVGIRLDAKLNDLVWHEDTDRVVLGLDDWLYSKESFSQLCDEGFNVADSVAKVEQLLAEVGSPTFLLTVVPAKPVVYPEHVPPSASRDPLARCVERERAVLRTSLEQHSWYVDLYGPLSAAAGDLLVFHPLDTHWNSQGALVGTETMIAALDEQLLKGTTIERSEHPHSPDLALMRGLPAETTAWWEVPVRTGVTSVESHDVTDVEAEEAVVPVPVRRYLGTGGDLWPGRTVIVHDSFLVSEDVFEQYVPFFTDVTFVHWDLVGYEEVDALISSADTLIVEVAERKFTARAERNISRFLSERGAG